MKRLIGWTGGAMLFFASIALADVKTDFDHNVNFSQYRTFAWKQSKPSDTNQIVNNSLIANRIEGAVDSQLASKGLKEDTSNPDLRIIYQVGAKSESDLTYMPGFGGRWGRWGWGFGGFGGTTMVNRYIQGSVVIDLVDAHTNQLVWRAVLTDTGSHLTDVQSNKNITKMVDHAFKQYPPRASHNS